MEKVEEKEMEVFRKKFEQYSELFSEYIKMVFPKSARKAGMLAEQRRLDSLWKNEEFLERRKRLSELQNELETLFLQIVERPKVAIKYAKDLRLIADLVWLWDKPYRINQALEKLPPET